MKPHNYPREMFGGAGAFVDGKARICGGFNVGRKSPNCYEYGLDDQTWKLSDYKLSVNRWKPASVMY